MSGGAIGVGLERRAGGHGLIERSTCGVGRSPRKVDCDRFGGLNAIDLVRFAIGVVDRDASLLSNSFAFLFSEVTVRACTPTRFFSEGSC